MKNTKLISLLAVVALLSMLGGCYPDKIDYVEEYDIAATMHDEEADFASYTTFSVIDTIIHITDDEEDDPNFSRDNDEKILALFRQNMSSLGYQEVPSPDSLNMPDLIMTLQAISSEYYQYWNYYWDYWGWYGGWNWWYSGYYYWDPWYPWNPWNPWYPGYVTSWTAGTVVVEMFDTHAFDPDNNKLGVVWAGALDGVLVKSGTADYSWSRIEPGINQLFEQSDYLGK